ncbi:MAG: DUF1190 domain-containing protein [Alphaproteobacteria bacterium]|nr:DUF1190 domain-containing protein [Alphaproteobacteria bacterium]
MRKSTAIRLVLLGSASLALAACDDSRVPTDAKFFGSLSECKTAFDDATCESKFKEADQARVDQGPRFTRKEECESRYGAGNCETRTDTSSGGSFFLPLMAGYMMGNLLGNRAQGYPVYRDRDGGAVAQTTARSGAGSNASLHRVGNFGNATASAGAFRPAPVAQIGQVERGGLGSSARSYSSAGS